MAKIAGSIQVKKDHPRFLEVFNALGMPQMRGDSVYVPPTHPIYSSLVGSAPMATSEAPKELTREEKVTRIRLALSLKQDVKDAEGEYQAAHQVMSEASERKAKAQGDYRVAMTGFSSVVPEGRSFQFGGRLYTHLYGDLCEVNESALSFDEPPPVEPPPVEPPPVEPPPVEPKKEEKPPKKKDGK